MTELEIAKIVGRGAGLAHAEGATWMVSGALPGERVAVEETARRRGIVEAQTVEVLDRPHPARLAEPCPHSGVCGGCDWAHVEVERGASLKAQVAAETARAFPPLAERLRRAPVTASPPAYRLRSRLHWDPDLRRLGFFARRSHEVAEIDACRIVSPSLLQSLPALIAALAAGGCGTGQLEWLESLTGNGAVLGWIPADGGDGALPDRTHLPPTVAGVHRLGHGGRIEAGWGEREVVMALPRPLAVPIGCFFQVNRHLVPWLFERVAELVGDDDLPTWDLHGGVGFLAAAALHRRPSPMNVVESFRPAAAAARRNLPEARVSARPAEDYLARRGTRPERALVITDPPRVGLSRGLRQRLAGWRPQRFLMMACDPGTWARDTAFLLDAGYRLGHLELVDLFPNTHHVEVLALVERG